MGLNELSDETLRLIFDNPKNVERFEREGRFLEQLLSAKEPVTLSYSAEPLPPVRWKNDVPQG